MPSVMLRPLALILAAISAAGLWLVSASALWSKGTGTPFTPFAWCDATQWWRANWWVNLWLVLAAAVPTVFLAMLLFGLFLVWRLRWRGRAGDTTAGRRCAGGRTRRDRQPRPYSMAIDG